MRRTLATLVWTALLMTAGCVSLGDDPPRTDTEPTVPARSNGTVEEPPVLVSQTEQTQLWLAWFQGIPEDRLTPFLPDGFQPTRCFPAAPGDAFDVFYFASEEVHRNLTGVPEEPVHKIWLATCVDGPDRFLREDANEPDWFTLAQWVDAPELVELMRSRGRAVEPITFDGGGNANSYGFEARDAQDRLIGGAFFASPRLATPTPLDLVPCEPVEHRGRSLSMGTDGDLHALDWTKTEATCLGTASIGWDEGTTVAKVLGSGDAPDWVFSDDVDEARFAWRALGAP